MARKSKIETAELSPPNNTENIELVVHRVMAQNLQNFISTLSLVVTLAALLVGVIGVGSYLWFFNLMVDNAVDKVRSELAIPKSAIIGMTMIDRDKSGAPTCPSGWRYLSSAEGRFVVGAMAEYAAGQRPVETLILGNSEEILGASNRGQPPASYRHLESNESPPLAASIGKTSTNTLWGQNKQNSETEPVSENVVPYVAAYFCIKE